MEDNQKARINDELAAQKRAGILNVAYFDTSKHEVSLYKDVLSVDEIKKHRLVPLYATPHVLKFGITNTTSHNTIKELKNRFQDQQVDVYLISETGFHDFVKRYDPPKQVIYQDISINSGDQVTQAVNVEKTLRGIKSDDMLAYIVKQAYKLGASDIHFETEIENVGIRFRIGGVLHPIAHLPTEKYHQLISSIAVAADISTSDPKPQTGHINEHYVMADGAAVEINLRLETVPTVHGMDAVLRLFNLDPDMMRLDRLGLRADEEEIINDIISHPNGLMLIVGPTGSGKTTTLYSVLNELNVPERKIVTLEDPVEYDIKGVTQIPVKSRDEENGFANNFKAVLRIDPDIIMVGEIRDPDTAKTALQAALTGHLVLSTYHASSAAAALTRMLGSIEQNPLFLSAIRLVQAQRLVRRLDDSSKQAYKPDKATLDWLHRVIETFPPHLERPSLADVTLYRPAPSEDNPFGYSGQVAVRELLIITPRVEEELKRPMRDITAHGLQELAVADGMTTMLHEGVIRALAGETTLEEVSRVVA